jgi:hypothetical protein
MTTYFIEEMFIAGVLMLASHYISLVHKRSELKKTISFETALSNLRKVINTGNLRKQLRVELLGPLFEVRKGYDFNSFCVGYYLILTAGLQIKISLAAFLPESPDPYIVL